MTDKMVAVILLNWNGYFDTIDCISSLLKIKDTDFKIIVCDNASSDNSIQKISNWAEENIPKLKSNGYINKSHVLYGKNDIFDSGQQDDAPLIIIDTGANLGFAGGNNVGLRYCLARSEFEYVWILNNDTVVDSNALSALVQKMRSQPDIGICGSKLVFYHTPSKVQAWGGSNFDWQFGYPVPIGHFADVSEKVSETDIEQQMAYVIGASMMVSMDFLKTVGLMTEDYFLYYEEIDWAFRARGKFRLGYSDKSIVCHKEGGSIGSSSSKQPSALSTYYLYKNRLKFNWRFNKKYFMFCLVRVAFEMLVYLKRGHFKTVKSMSRGMVAFFIEQTSRH